MKQFSPMTQAFYDSEFEYPSLPDDLIEIDDVQHKLLLANINKGCHIREDLTASQPRPNPNYIWKDGDWVLGVDKAVLQSQIWEQIKAHRHAVTRGGVYVKSVKKWFHTDDSSRTQYLALQILPELPADLMWKTMDNSFVKLTKPLLTELAMTILANEQADFANAERHRMAMLQVDNPLDYDYSDGWTAIYEPTTK
ncbi:DUF4376 domain-containing protein [Moraxella nasibovis]|uniref:DUF4376 domain-containing protein n=1 Tax=Moraxella nasibovis TaxID=2904120 RepID=UPI00240F29A8|nr:DUF4376 domain-containing protein [Moraxella nasibovis]WFF38033.1 DUF4376 domain-containing protein [Moraxella nasibovis]